MEVVRDEQPEWLTNSYLVYDRAGGTGLLIDANGRTGSLLEQARSEGVTVEHLLLTHEHWDHAVDARALAEGEGLTVHAHPGAAAALDFETTPIGDGDELGIGEMTVRAIHTPGHSDSHLAFLIDGTDLFSGDVLFAGTVGGTMLPGETGFAELKGSVMDGEVWESNPFVALWRGTANEGTEPCEVEEMGEATLVLWAPDYDGTNKAWVRFPDGSEGIIGGSRIKRD
jgi:hydroxyacylglutathione hydrolase